MFQVPGKTEWLSAKPEDLERFLRKKDRYINKKEKQIINSRLQQVLYKAVDTNDLSVVNHLMNSLPIDFRSFPQRSLANRAIFERAFRAKSFDALATLICHGSEDLVINYNFHMAHLFLSLSFGHMELNEAEPMLQPQDDGSLVWFLVQEMAQNGVSVPLNVALAMEEKLDLALWNVSESVENSKN